MKRVLFIASHRPGRAPGQRFRFEMFFDELEKAGMQCELSYLLDANDDAVFYQKGHYLKKIGIALKSYRKRIADVKRIQEFDLVVLFREALMTRSTFFEKAVSKAGIPMIFDFDDAIWIRDVSQANRAIAWMKNPDKIKTILPLCAGVTAGNEYLATFARQYNQNVHIVPSTIDETFHYPLNDVSNVTIIGWSGSMTTMMHFERVIDVLRKLKIKYGDTISFVTIGAKSQYADELGIQFIPWSAENENYDLNKIDIGLMPLPDDSWAQGKCGMKALLYMAAGKATIASPVGVNTEIIEHGVTGFLAETDQDWFESIDGLIADKVLMQQIGQAGREKVVNKYSKGAWSERLIDVYKNAMKA
jgi:glycosyltransferase involved in cell wall biosynthesis